MIHSATLIRREVFTQLGGYNENFACAQDYDLFARALLSGFQLANIPEVMHQFRIHPQSIGSSKKKIQHALAKIIQNYYNEHKKNAVKDSQS